jgi:hypothetical protein
VLVLGSPAFLSYSADMFQGYEVLFLGSKHRTSSWTPPGPAWLCLQRQAFGGPTHYVALFRCQGHSCVLAETVLRHLVCHIFDFGARLDPWDDTADPTGTMMINDILHPSGLTCQVVHPILFYRSGWGSHPLTADELGITFGFPAWLHTGGLSASMFPCMPL